MNIGTQTAANPLKFVIGGAEKARLDGSGNLLVGKSALDFGNVGAEILPTGVIRSAVGGGHCLMANRKDSDGEIINLRKDGTTVGSISTVNGDLYIGTSNTALRFTDSAADIRPVNSSGTNLDATTDLGASATRFKDLYLSGGAYLGGTATANKLDDYEEGTWSPTAQFYDGTMTVNSATYTKIGNLVVLRCSVSFDSTTDSSGVGIQNLPFNHSGASKGNGGFITATTVTTAVRMKAAGTGTIKAVQSNDANINYTSFADSTLGFIFIYEAA